MGSCGSNKNACTIYATVSFEVVGLYGDAAPVACAMTYDRCNPYAVTLDFITESDSSAWIFGRELLIEGSLYPSGVGDVAVWPARDEQGNQYVVISLKSAEGNCDLRADAGDIATFVERMKVKVPLGTESKYVDVTSVITQILNSDA